MSSNTALEARSLVPVSTKLFQGEGGHSVKIVMLRPQVEEPSLTTPAPQAPLSESENSVLSSSSSAAVASLQSQSLLSQSQNSVISSSSSAAAASLLSQSLHSESQNSVLSSSRRVAVASLHSQSSLKKSQNSVLSSLRSAIIVDVESSLDAQRATLIDTPTITSNPTESSDSSIIANPTPTNPRDGPVSINISNKINAAASLSPAIVIVIVLGFICGLIIAAVLVRFLLHHRRPARRHHPKPPPGSPIPMPAAPRFAPTPAKTDSKLAPPKLPDRDGFEQRTKQEDVPHPLPKRRRMSGELFEEEQIAKRRRMSGETFVEEERIGHAI